MDDTLYNISRPDTVAAGRYIADMATKSAMTDVLIGNMYVTFARSSSFLSSPAGEGLLRSRLCLACLRPAALVCVSSELGVTTVVNQV
jgi:hypothetical protein